MHESAMKTMIEISIKLPIMVRSSSVLGRLGIASICSRRKRVKSHQLPWSVQFMNGLSTHKVGGFHEKSHSVHEIEIITDRTEQLATMLQFSAKFLGTCRASPKHALIAFFDLCEAVKAITDF
jgi:hypothetical protein